MIIERQAVKAKRVVDCHHGKGVLWCAEMLADYQKKGTGFKYIHDNSLPVVDLHLLPGLPLCRREQYLRLFPRDL